MKLVLINYKCHRCQHVFTAPGIAPGGHGAFLLHGGRGQLAYLDALADDTYDEVHRLMLRYPGTANTSPLQQAELLQTIYGPTACDPDAISQPFRIGAPSCPHCGSTSSLWSISEPPEFVHLAVPPVTHVAWSALSPLQKEQRVHTQLSQQLADHAPLVRLG